jgi:hypothetical protein
LPPTAQLTATLVAPAAPAGRLPAPGKARLPTAEEARENPNLVISLEPASASRPPAPASPPGDAASADTTLEPVDLPPVADSGLALARENTPTDLPPPGSGPRLALPEPPPDPAAPGRTARRASRSLAERLTADPKSIVELLAWAAGAYFRKPIPFFLLAVVLVMPASFLESCLAAALLPRPGAVATAQVPDLASRKAELAKRIQESRARGQIDSEAAGALAELTTAEATQVEAGEGSGWLRPRLIMFVQGLLVLGLAIFAACGVLAVALFDHDSGAALPALADVWPIVVARRELLLASLLPAGLLVALGHSLYVVPGLVASVLFLFVPHVVIFEKKGGREALVRSVELAKADAIRCVLLALSFALAGAVVALLTELLLPTSASRATAFVHFLVCDLVVAGVLPIPALVVARLYLDLRGGKTAESLSRAARS